MADIIPFNYSFQQQVIDFILNIQQNEFGIPVTAKDQPDLASIPSIYQVNNGNFWIAVQGNKLIGTIALIDIGDGQTALRKMFVHADYRGKDKGLGQLLLDTVFSWCREKQLTDIYLGTVEVLKAAQRFYEKNGFRRVDINDLPVSFPIVKVDTIFYHYNLHVN
jgi:GNAT superfamily N-acetyltransferase